MLSPVAALGTFWQRLMRATSGRLGAFGLTLGLMVTAAGPLLQQCAPPPPASAQQQVVDLVNQQRAAAGLAPVTVDGTLATAAQNHSQEQANTGVMTHTGLDGSNAGQRIARLGYPAWTWGENVAAGYGSAQAVMDGWMGSSGHRANILNGNFREIGIGLAHKADGTPFWTMVLASR